MATEKNKTHIYCIPGLGASISIFEFIQLPYAQFELHYIPWIIPESTDSISDYAKKMCSFIKHNNTVLLGVSFGGIMAQEMSKHISVKKVVIISSIKTRHELPKRFLFVRETKLYKLLPTKLLEKVNAWERLFFNESNKKAAKAYEKYLNILDKRYLDWAIENVLFWNQNQPIPNLIHIHGSKDLVFPIENISNCIIIPNGTHAAILRRSRWLNQNLPSLINE